jgi:2,4-dienoyl-CoA reductase (NADPH2)
MGSMHTGLEEADNGFTRMAAYFAERARGGVGLIVTGGVAPNRQGWVSPFAAKLTTETEANHHREVTDAVHAEEGKICLQILHAGRYSYTPLAVAPSAIKSPISMFTPWALTASGIRNTIQDFAETARLAKVAGYDGVEVMGSEGYLLNEFISSKTNKRTDEWGGSYANRIRFPVEVVRAVREAVGREFIIIYRLSMLDLVEDGSSWEEVVELAQKIEEAGATIINTGIGWHEARIPTIATMVPRAAFTWVTHKLKGKVGLPLVCTNRINTPEVAERVLAEGHADMVSMARPFLADPEFVKKAKEGRASEINVCIGCNQACLDHVFKQKICSCLVNPRACHETEIQLKPVASEAARKRIAVVGAGPAGLAFAATAARRGHRVTVFEASGEIGGQFNLAKQIPGKEEFYETLRYFKGQLELHKVDVKLSTWATPEALAQGGFQEVVVATGVTARTPKLPGIDHPSVIGYADLLAGRRVAGKRVAVMGAGGIGFDVAEYLTHDPKAERPSVSIPAFLKQWGVDPKNEARGGVTGVARQLHAPYREITLLQRKQGKHGETLGKTTGWIHRAQLKDANVKMIAGVTYKKVDENGHLHVEDAQGKQKVIECDSIVVCAGQESLNTLQEPLAKLNKDIKVHVIGGAFEAGELDAKRAIDQAVRLADKI